MSQMSTQVSIPLCTGQDFSRWLHHWWRWEV